MRLLRQWLRLSYLIKWMTIILRGAYSGSPGCGHANAGGYFRAEPNEQPYFNLVAFTDLMLANTLTVTERMACLKGAKLIAEGTLSSSQLAGKLTGLFSISLQQQQRIIAQQALPLSEVSPDKRDEYLIYKCIFTVREFLLLGYFTSEKLQAS